MLTSIQDILVEDEAVTARLLTADVCTEAVGIRQLSPTRCKHQCAVDPRTRLTESQPLKGLLPDHSGELVTFHGENRGMADG